MCGLDALVPYFGRVSHLSVDLRILDIIRIEMMTQDFLRETTNLLLVGPLRYQDVWS